MQGSPESSAPVLFWCLDRLKVPERVDVVGMDVEEDQVEVNEDEVRPTRSSRTRSS